MANTNLAMFYNSNEGDRVYDADDMTDWLKPFFLTGVFNGELQVTANNDMSVTIAPGYVNIGGKTKHFIRNTTLDLETSSATLDRIDAVVVRRDDTNRDIYLTIVKGGNSGSPVPPDLIRDGAIYDLRLAEIYVAAGAVRITQAEITDTRMNDAVCGWVASTVQEIDFSQATAQFDEFFTQYKANVLTQYQQYLINIGDTEAAANQAYLDMKGRLDDLYSEYRTYLLNNYNQYLQDIATDKAAADEKLSEMESALDDMFNEYETNVLTQYQAYLSDLTDKESDASDDYSDFQSSLATMLSGFQTQFTDWFNNIKDQLDEDAAGHLQNEIDDIIADQDQTDDDVSNLQEVFEMYVLQNRAIINSLSYNQIAILMELETLSQAAVAGTSENVVIEMFDSAVTPIKGYYDAVNKRVYA